jgi:hypothetical protein
MAMEQETKNYAIIKHSREECVPPDADNDSFADIINTIGFATFIEEFGLVIEEAICDW